jgi:hypothetical protein
MVKERLFSLKKTYNAMKRIEKPKDAKEETPKNDTSSSTEKTSTSEKTSDL